MAAELLDKIPSSFLEVGRMVVDLPTGGEYQAIHRECLKIDLQGTGWVRLDAPLTSSALMIGKEHVYIKKSKDGQYVICLNQYGGSPLRREWIPPEELVRYEKVRVEY